jgi:RNA polymerase sigma factor (sigma-70 family)
MNRVEELTELYTDKRQSFINQVTRRVGSKADAEDVVQEAMVKALTYLETWSGEKPLEHWFRVILFNATKAFKTVEWKEGMTDNEHTDTAEELHIREELVDRVVKDIEKVKEPDQTALKGVLMHQWTPMEVAEYSPMTANHIRVVLHKFRKKMQQKYRQEVVV